MIKIMLDSSSDCQNERELYDYLVPIRILLEGREYRDGLDLDRDRFYSILSSGTDFPRTSQPAPEDFLRIFRQVAQEGSELIYFALSSALSGTYQTACIAKSMLGYDGIHVFDTLCPTHMIGVFARHARDLIAGGAIASEIVAACERLKGKIHLFAALHTLEYLHRGGRLSRASATVGTLAGIKPLISITAEGTVGNIGKSIGMNRAIQTLLSKLDADRIDPRFPICSLYTSGTENAQKLEQKLAAAGYRVARRLQVGPTVGAHIGPEACGVLFVTK